MADPLEIIMTILFICGAILVLNRVLNYMKNNHYCDRVYAEG